MKTALNIIWIALVVTLCPSAIARTPIYDPEANPYDDLEVAVLKAAKDDKLVLVIFGADWCPDCRMLDYHLKQEGLKEVIDENFHVVKVDVGERDNNMDFIAEFGNPISKGIPSIAILDARSKIQYVSTGGEPATARSAKTESLKKWFQSIVEEIETPGNSGPSNAVGLKFDK